MDELVTLQRIYYEKRAYEFLKKGVKIYDPKRFECQGEVDIGYDTEIRPNVSLTAHAALVQTVLLVRMRYLPMSKWVTTHLSCLILY